MNIKKNSGFSLIELMVSISIMTILMSVVLYGHAVFVDQASLSSASQDLTISMREAQIYGLNTRETSVGSGDFSAPYGIYFNPAYTPTTYYIFTDTNNNDLYDAGNGCGSGVTECVSEVTLKNGVYIDDVCYQVEGVDVCSGVNAEHITFNRPDPDAKIYYTTKRGDNKSAPQTIAKVKLKSKDGKITYVVIDNAGQIMMHQ